MKKIIRNSVFETNSSSTHSLTIYKKRSDDPKGLVEGNILYPDVFYKLSEEYDSGDMFNGKRWKAHTQAEKAAVLFLYLNYANLDLQSKNPDFSETLVKKAIEYATVLLPYSDVVMGTKCICPYADNGTVEIVANLVDLLQYETTDIDRVKMEIKKFLDVVKDSECYIEIIDGNDY